MYTIRQSAAMGFGKLRRVLFIAFRKKRVVRMLERRRGECLRCGACCKLLVRCPYYDDSSGGPRCSVYQDRPGPCGIFPLDELDLKERDPVHPHRKCGYRFEDPPDGNGNGNHGERLPETSIRWGPPKSRPQGRHHVVRAAWTILRSCLGRSNGRP